MFRVALLPDGTMATGPGVPGRGAWLCRGSPRCFTLAVKRRQFDRALRARVDPGAIERLGQSEVVAAGEGAP
ncbi:MAG: YlxR family protein [Acidimicrobiales bacterium]